MYMSYLVDIVTDSWADCFKRRESGHLLLLVALIAYDSFLD